MACTICPWPIPWFLHYEGEVEGEVEAEEETETEIEGENLPAGKFMTQKEIDAVVLKRTEKARKQGKDHLKRLEQLQKSLTLTEEQKESLEVEIDAMRKQVLTAEELRKREEKRAKDTYESRLVEAQEQAQTWKSKYNDLKINYEVTDSATKHGVLPQSLPFLSSFLRPQIKLAEQKDEETGNVDGYVAMVDFSDQGVDGRPIKTQMTVEDTIKRMKELPDQYGHLFTAPPGGVGGSSGRPSGNGRTGFKSGMSMAEYVKLRKENPDSLYNH